MKIHSLLFLCSFFFPLWVYADVDGKQSGHDQIVISNENSHKQANKADVSIVDQSSVNLASGNRNDEEPKTSSIERWVQPLTRWAEDQIRDTSLIRKPNKKTLKSQPSSINLRDAIRIAKQEYPGMVLGAESKSDSGKVRYEVRIISQNGVIKTVSISSEPEDQFGVNDSRTLNKDSSESAEEKP